VNTRIPIIYDTDLGEDIDDLYALYFALCHPALDVIAVTTAHGDTVRKSRLARKVLRMAGREDIPVGTGIGLSEARRQRGQHWPDSNVAASFLDYVTPEDPEFSMVFPEAQEVLTTAISTATAPVALVGEGAFSNLAQLLLSANTTLRQRIGCIAIMGGENDRVMNEWNVHCDPEAADVLFNSGVPLFMGTFEVTAQLIMTMTEVEYEFSARPESLYCALNDCTRLWWRKQGGRVGPVLYDLVPLFWLIDPDCVKTRPAHIRVELEGTYTRGQTVRVSGVGDGDTLESLSLNANAMVRDFVATIHTFVQNTHASI